MLLCSDKQKNQLNPTPTALSSCSELPLNPQCLASYNHQIYGHPSCISGQLSPGSSSGSSIIQQLGLYSSFELLWLRLHIPAPPPLLHLWTDSPLPPCRRYIHRGSRRHFHEDSSEPIHSWPSTRLPHRNTGRTVDHSVLPNLPATTAGPAAQQNTATVNFGLINIR